VDNYSSRTISGYKEDFDINTLTTVTSSHDYNRNTHTNIPHMGTIRWTILDDNGVKRTISIPNSFYVLDSDICLLSPQHWAQEVNDNSPSINDTWCTTYYDEIIVYWQQSQLSKTISIDWSGSNTGILWTVPNNNKYKLIRDQFHNKHLQLHSAPSTYSTESFTGEEVTIDNIDGHHQQQFLIQFMILTLIFNLMIHQLHFHRRRNSCNVIRNYHI
jgi:hypothetical protein